MNFLEACEEAYKRSVKRSKEEKRLCSVDLNREGCFSGVVVYSDGEVGMDTEVELKDLKKDDWEVENV